MKGARVLLGTGTTVVLLKQVIREDTLRERLKKSLKTSTSWSALALPSLGYR